MNLNTQIRLKVMTLREELGFSQSELASAIGISRSHMNKLENGTLQMSLVYLKQIADVLNVPIDRFFIEAYTKEDVVAFDFIGFNTALVELATESLENGENYFTVDFKDLVMTEEKLNQWKENAQAGSLIIGSVGCRYLIFSDAKPHPKKRGYLLTKYGFLNIDHAGWELSEPRFDSTDELIEWFAGNVENPIIDVIPSGTLEKTMPGQNYL